MTHTSRSMECAPNHALNAQDVFLYVTHQMCKAGTKRDKSMTGVRYSVLESKRLVKPNARDFMAEVE